MFRFLIVSRCTHMKVLVFIICVMKCVSEVNVKCVSLCSFLLTTRNLLGVLFLFVVECCKKNETFNNSPKNCRVYDSFSCFEAIIRDSLVVCVVK